MKKLILLLFIPLVFTCSSDSSDDNIDDTNPVYLDSNGVTIKARDWAVVGESGTINGITYTIVNRETLVNMIANQEDLTRICTSRVINMSDLFYNINSFNGFSINQDISSWDVSNVIYMQRMFFNATEFNISINHWDVSSVADMSYMFSCAWVFNQPLNSWDVSNVTNMQGMFSCTQEFNQDLSSWNVSNVTDCSSFCQNATNWSLPKPNFSNCGDTGCD